MFEYLLEDLSNIFGKTETSKEEKDTKKFGEGYAAEEVRSLSYHALNSYNRYIYQQANTEAAKVRGYRTMALYPEIGEVLEEICDEAVKEDTDGKIVHLRFKDEKFEKGKPRENLLREFDDMFYKRIGVQYLLWDYFYTFLVDGRMYLENIVNEKRKNEGIIGLKKLPATTMDFLYDAKTGKTLEYKQKVGGAFGRGGRENTITFDPAQITFFDYGLYGKTRKHIFGYLEKAKIPYRQLKLLEDSAIIYRIVRAPERLVFKVDVGNMPRHKAEQYVNRMKTAYKRQMSYNPNSASIQQSSNILCLDLDTEISLLDGRELSLKEIIKEYESGKRENWVYSLDQKTGEIYPGKIKWAGITRKNAELIRVWLDNGKYADVTPDHKFIKRDFSECRAEDLKSGDSLAPLYRRKRKIGKNANEYEQTLDLKERKWRFTHTISVKGQYGGEEKRGVVHHKDFNRFNNNPSNLEWRGLKEHIKWHGKNASDNLSKNNWLDNYWQIPENNVKRKERINELRQTESFEKARVAGLKKSWKTKNHRENHVNGIRDFYADKEKSKENRKRHSDYLKENNPMSKSEVRERFGNKFDEKAIWSIFDKIIENDFVIKRTCRAISEDGELMGHLKRLNENRVRASTFNKFVFDNMTSYAKYLGYETCMEMVDCWKVPGNHKVVKVEKLAERKDTGCISVDNVDSNFALQVGVIIKNSMLENFWIPTSSEGRGSNVDVLQGGANLGEIEDIVYFMKKLYKSLKYPAQRVLGDQSGVLSHEGRSSSEITRDEVKFAKFIERVQQKFCLAMERLFLLNLELRGTFNRYDLQRDDFEITFNPVSSYREIKDLEMEDARGGVYNTFLGDESISKTFLKKRFLRWSEEDLAENKRVLEEDLKWEKKIAKLRMDVEQAAQPPEAEVGGGFGGEEGGGGGFDTPKGGGEGEGEKPAESKPGKENKI